MAKNYVQLDILLVIGTSLSTGNGSIKTKTPAAPQRLEIERLEEACWNGLLRTILPEVWIDPPNDGIPHLWEARKAVLS
jgi:hypothetical protein